MARGLSEEEVTLEVIAWLRERGFTVLAHDFPGSGTGVLIRPSTATSRADGFIPDILARGRGVLLLLEAKPAFNRADVRKLVKLKGSSPACDAIAQFGEVTLASVRFGIAVGAIGQRQLDWAKQLIDVVLVFDGKSVTVALGHEVLS